MDKALLAALGWEEGPDDDAKHTLEHRHGAPKATIFFMPHCPWRLSSNLLWANWDPDLLAGLIIVGNKFVNERPPVACGRSRAQSQRRRGRRTSEDKTRALDY